MQADPNHHGIRRSPTGAKLTARSAELFGGPLDGGTVGEPLELYVQFILLPNNGATQGPYPVYTYRYERSCHRYHYCG